MKHKIVVHCPALVTQADLEWGKRYVSTDKNLNNLNVGDPCECDLQVEVETEYESGDPEAGLSAGWVASVGDVPECIFRHRLNHAQLRTLEEQAEAEAVTEAELATETFDDYPDPSED